MHLIPCELTLHFMFAQTAQTVDWITMFKASGVIGIVELLLGGVAAAMIVERIIAYSHESTHMESFMPEFEERLRAGDIQGAYELCESRSGHIPEVFKWALTHLKDGLAVVRKTLAVHIELNILPRLRRRLAALAVIAKTLPMLGLLGTVYGMMGAFIQIAQPGGNRDPALLAQNIGLALVTTFLGLILAIPVIYFITYFRARVQQFEVDLEYYVQRLLELLAETARHAKQAPAAPSGTAATANRPGR